MTNLFMLVDNATCGLEIDAIVPAFTRSLITVVKIIVPIILIVYGIIGMFKAATSNDEKAMKEAQKTLISRIIYGILIFFVVAIVQFVISILPDEAKGDNDSDTNYNTVACIKCFTSRKNSCSN